MATRAAICIGVDRTAGLTPLTAAAKGAEDFADWATAQGCDVQVLTDRDGKAVHLHDVFQAVQTVVEAATYAQLYVYFSGHGILLAPGTEYWLLSGAPRNPNEAVNLFRSIEDARRAGIPHVLFVSDACRSAVRGASLNGVLGGVIFPNQATRSAGAEVDVFYATQPGDPAYEVPEAQATQQYRGLFTHCLLTAVTQAGGPLVEPLPASAPPAGIITSRRLRPYLEKEVLKAATAVHLTLNQQPQVRVETASPQYFALVAAPPARSVRPVTGAATPRTLPIGPQHEGQGRGVFGLEPAVVAGTGAERPPRRYGASLGPAVERLCRYSSYLPADTDTGFTILGANLVAVEVSPAWALDILSPGLVTAAAEPAQYLRLLPVPAGEATRQLVAAGTPRILLEFAEGVGTLLAVLPGYVGVVVVEEGRVVSVNYRLTAEQSRQLTPITVAREELKAVAAVTARQGNFTLLDQPAGRAAIKRYFPLPDPALALYLAYAYAQRGQVEQVAALQRALVTGESLPPLFDLALLTARYQPEMTVVDLPEPRVPLLAQGWALLGPDSPLHRPWHEQLRPHLVPSLWSTYTREGLVLARPLFLLV